MWVAIVFITAIAFSNGEFYHKLETSETLNFNTREECEEFIDNDKTTQDLLKSRPGSEAFCKKTEGSKKGQGI